MAFIQLTRGYVTQVDEQDFKELNKHRWCVMGPVNGGYYAIRRTKGKIISLARTLCGALDGQTADHLNGDTLDNRRSNLRLCRGGNENERNAKVSKRNTTGATGVVWKEDRGFYEVRVMVKGKNHYIGKAESVEEGEVMRRRFLENLLQQDYQTQIVPKRFHGISAYNGDATAPRATDRKCKLTPEQVAQIRASKGEILRETAKKFSISRTLVWMIQNNKIWKQDNAV